MLLGGWGGGRWNQIKTKLRGVRLRAHKPVLSMNFDRCKGNKRRGEQRVSENKEARADTVSQTSAAPLGGQAAEFQVLLP